MFQIHSITGRIIIGKLTGFVIGLIAMLLLASIGFPVWSTFGLGTLLMFMIMGVVIGLVGMFDRSPIVDFVMDWKTRGAVVGFVFGIMYVLLSYRAVEVIMESQFINAIGLSSPFWVVLDMVVIGMIIGFLETKIAGEGQELPLK